MLNLINKFFGSSSSRLTKSYAKTVEMINKLEPTIKSLTDSELQQKTNIFKEKVNQGIFP